eukprot:CAMPEP_0185769010 /NCGR_PEP_ID=MMETSP1174-20130828/53312_1 /TAXON_ID=35687 /ORGANISM="Dictyocha speculum, Strain CCMP1381" /LENGTH=275 /DNA_ID=CAMNT_0028453941 /DNA_START=60 /DNA_END=887 /DNA_ORIENTATION=-
MSSSPEQLPMTVGFIGGGMMASAMWKGLLKSGVSDPEKIIVFDISPQCLQRAISDGVKTAESTTELVNNADVIMIAVKPGVVPTVLAEIKEVLSEQLVVSIAAGVSLDVLEGSLNPGARVIRVMPNTPCMVNETAAGFVLGTHAQEEHRQTVSTILGACGLGVEAAEKDMDAITGLSGSGPAYVYLMIEALADGGVRQGLTRATALALAAQTVKGAAMMVQETGMHPGQLKDNVCSPGGTTIAGVEALENHGFRAAAMAAVSASATRSRAMSGKK